MYGLDMDDLPEYCNSGFFRFRNGQKHTTRICPYDVCVIMLEGILYFNEDGKPVQVSKGEYYIQRSGLLQEGVIPSSDAFYYVIHFHGNMWTVEMPCRFRVTLIFGKMMKALNG